MIRFMNRHEKGGLSRLGLPMLSTGHQAPQTASILLFKVCALNGLTI